MREIVFQWPLTLVALIGIVPLWWLIGRAWRKKQEAREKLGQTRENIRSRRDWIWLTVFVAIVVALARPGYNPTRHSVSQSGRDVVFVLDVSRSMLAQDAYPSRLEAAKQAIRDCLAGFMGEQVGLVIYAGSSSISCPLTADYDFLRYMLTQVQPRSVEFGGTLLLSAIEKSIDQVLDPDRRGYQDLVVLTDGEDHGPGVKRIAEQIKESGVQLLLIGIGDSVSGSRIPIQNEEGETIPLRHDGQVVYTKLNDRELGSLARMCPEGKFANVGTLPFHLGEIYQSFIEDKATISSGGDTGYVVYKEAAFLILPVAFVLALWASGLMRIQKSTGIAILFMAAGIGDPLKAQPEEERVSFEMASEWLENGKYDEANAAFSELAHEMERQGESAENVAAALFNQGLASHLQAEALAESSPRDALGAAVYAQDLFFEAARVRPGYKRASLRLESLAVMVEALVKQVEEQEKKEQERDEKIEALLERIQELLENQTDLKRVVEKEDIERRPLNRRSRNTPPSTVSQPENADANGVRFEREQAILRTEGQSIEQHMFELNSEFSIAGAVAQNSEQMAMESILKRPLELMGQAVEAQTEAEELLPQWRYWPAARARQSVAIDRLKEILDLFASNSDDQGEGEWDDEDWEEFMDTDPGEAVASSLPMKGEFREDALMQPLPVPNFSAEDILMEETSSQQFRQEQRAKANAGKVEKDW